MSFRIKIDQKACIGCGACAATCEAMFRINDDGKAESARGSFDTAGCAHEAADGCPVSCITVVEK